MAEKKYTENLGLTQQDEEDFVDGAEISRSFRVLDEKVWKNTVDMDNAKQELYKKIGNIETNDLFGYTPETITYGDKGYLAFGYKDGETQSFTYLTSTNAKEWQNVGYTDRIKHLEYLDSGTYIGATNANMIHYLYGESGEFTQFPTSQNWEVNKIKAFGSRALIIGSKIIRAYMDYALDLYTLGVLPDEPLIDIVKINDEDKFVGCTEHIVYEYQNLIGSGTETQELIFEKNDEVISSILFKDNRLYYTTQSGNIYRSEPEHYTLMVKVAEGFETGKNKLIHYSGMFLLQTEHNVYTSTDCKEWKTTLTTNKKFNNAKYANDKFAICGDEGVKFLSIEKSLKEQVNELNSALYPVGIVLAFVNGFDPNKSLLGEWEPIAKGQTLVGVNESDPDFNTVEKSGGLKDVTLSIKQIPVHSHQESDLSYVYTDEHPANNSIVTTNQNGRQNINMNIKSKTYTKNAGEGGAHSNLQPYITVFYWVRRK